MKAFSLIFCLFFLVGCGHLYEVIPQTDFSFSEGKKVLQSVQPHSSVEIEIAQETYFSALPFLIQIRAKADTPIHFDLKNLTFLKDSKVFIPLSAKEVLHGNYDFRVLLQNFNIPIPPSETRFSYSPNLFFTPFGGFFYPYWGTWDHYSYYRDGEFSRRILASKYLRKTTLQKDHFLGGFVAIVLQDFDSSILELRVQIGMEMHLFNFGIKKMH